MQIWSEIKQKRITQTVVAYLAGGWVVLAVVDQLVNNQVIPEIAYNIALILYLFGFLGACIVGWHHGEKGAQKPPKIEIAALALVSISALGTSFWVIQSEIAERNLEGAIDASISRNAFIPYLEGLELVDRWDKDENLNRAIELFREATTSDPEFALAFARLSMALGMKFGLTGDETLAAESARHAEEALRLNPDLAPVQVALGRVHSRQGNYDLALASFQLAVSIDANDATANQAFGTMLARAGRLDEAEDAFLKAISLESENPRHYFSYAVFLDDQGRFNEAADQWEAVLRVAPDHYAALVNFGGALGELGRTSEAISMYERAIQIRPSFMAYSNLGTAYSRGERYEESVDAYLRALDFDDSDWLAWGNLAFVYSWMSGMDSRASEAFRHAIDLAESERKDNPRDPYVNSDLALYYAKTGEENLAVERISTAIALSPNSSDILAYAGEAYEILGQRDNALEYINQSVESGLSIARLQRNPEFKEFLEDPRFLEAQL